MYSNSGSRISEKDRLHNLRFFSRVCNCGKKYERRVCPALFGNLPINARTATIVLNKGTQCCR